MRKSFRALLLWVVLSGTAAALAWLWIELGPALLSAEAVDPDSIAGAVEGPDGSARWLALIVAGVLAVAYIGVRRHDG